MNLSKHIADEGAIALTKFLAGSHKWLIEDVEKQMKEWAALLTNGVGVNLGGYGYYPSKSLKKWTATDGSVVECSLLNLILVYGGKDKMKDFMDVWAEADSDLLLRRRMKQDGYEAHCLVN
jgi:hypothetical protein